VDVVSPPGAKALADVINGDGDINELLVIERIRVSEMSEISE